MGWVIAIVGLPASGKTFLANEISRNVKDSFVVNDPRDWNEFQKTLIQNCCGTVIVTDPWLCLSEVRQTARLKFQDLSFKVMWIFFENDVNACSMNNHSRNEGRSTDEIRWFSKQYTIPQNSTVISVWKRSL